MFESISFLFLLALAFVAWVLLCFQHVVQIQQRGSSDFRVELYTERPGITFEPQMCHSPTEENPSGSAYEFAASFGVIFALTFVISKLLQLAEVQANSYLKCCNVQKTTSSAEDIQQLNDLKPIEPMMDHNEELKEQLNMLHSQCLEMRELLHELRISSSSSSYGSAQLANETSQDSIVVWHQSDLMTDGTSNSMRATRSDSSQNIFITNSHIHINVNVDLRRQASRYSRKQSEFYQVFGKYITEPKENPMITGIRCNNILM
ncbi:uncharacterized protein LOC108108698 [Drosophila eugracilis]|uniref:uncharacterized protein LOC108108698 n=1 Tax=Drosophila eugracilis TaxID=29029 RepID=UPI0007E73E3C|nr:uncharacterized protein LOC108108698 [Drosophila eugracilis]